MEYAAVLFVTVVVYGLALTLVLNLFELWRRKLAREPNARLSEVFRDALAPYRAARE